MKYEIKTIVRDGFKIMKLKCPKCSQWADIDDDQFNGRISTQCEQPNCTYHETVNFNEISEVN